MAPATGSPGMPRRRGRGESWGLAHRVVSSLIYAVFYSAAVLALWLLGFFRDLDPRYFWWMLALGTIVSIASAYATFAVLSRR